MLRGNFRRGTGLKLNGLYNIVVIIGGGIEAKGEPLVSPIDIALGRSLANRLYRRGRDNIYYVKANITLAREMIAKADYLIVVAHGNSEWFVVDPRLKDKKGDITATALGKLLKGRQLKRLDIVACNIFSDPATSGIWKSSAKHGSGFSVLSYPSRVLREDPQSQADFNW